MDYTLVPNLMSAWKHPIRVTPERYQKFSSNPPIRSKRKAERLRLEEEAKRMKLMQTKAVSANDNDSKTKDGSVSSDATTTPNGTTSTTPASDNGTVENGSSSSVSNGGGHESNDK